MKNNSLKNTTYQPQQIIECLRSLYYPLLFIYYFSLHNIFFRILLVFASFLQTYYDIYFFHILFFYSYLPQISFYICPLLAFLIFHYYFYNTLLLYLVLHPCFFNSRLCYPFLYTTKKKKIFFIKYYFYQLNQNYSLIFLLHAHSYTQNKFCIHFFNMNNSNIFKFIAFLHYIYSSHCKDMVLI